MSLDTALPEALCPEPKPDVLAYADQQHQALRSARAAAYTACKSDLLQRAASAEPFTPPKMATGWDLTGSDPSASRAR